MLQKKAKLTILKDLFTVHKFSPNYEIPIQVFESHFYSISKTEDELSIVCKSSLLLDSHYKETGWSCIKVVGSLDFSLTGILAGISLVLAKAEISIFAISTFDTDYILLKTEKVKSAIKELSSSGYIIVNN